MLQFLPGKCDQVTIFLWLLIFIKRCPWCLYLVDFKASGAVLIYKLRIFTILPFKMQPETGAQFMQFIQKFSKSNFHKCVPEGMLALQDVTFCYLVKNNFMMIYISLNKVKLFSAEFLWAFHKSELPRKGEHAAFSKLLNYTETFLLWIYI